MPTNQMPDVATIAFTTRDLFEAASLILLLLAVIVAMLVARDGWPAVRQQPQRLGRLALMVVGAVVLGYLLKEVLGSTAAGSAIVTGLFLLALAAYVYLFRWTRKDSGPETHRQLRRTIVRPISWRLVGVIVIALVALAVLEALLFPR